MTKSSSKNSFARGATHLVSTFETRDFGADAVRIGDLNGDGAPDLLFAQTFTPAKPGTNEILCRTGEIRCLTATTILGEMLWQYGEPSVTNGCNAGDIPVQVYDWDGDGENEVLFIRQAVYAELYPGDPTGFRGRAKRYEGTATLVALDGRTGHEKTAFPTPAPADGSIAFADLTGRGRREDLVLKDCYGEHVYGVSHTGELLWHWHGGPWPDPGHNCPQDPKVSVADKECEAGHYPAVADIDGDGRDEVFIGFALIDHNGRVLFRKDTGGGGRHSDANYIVRLADGAWRLLFGNHGVHCLAADGTELWHNPLVFGEAQHVVAGRFRFDSQLQAAVIDRGFPRTPEGKPAGLFLFDIETGKEIWRRPQLPGGWCAACMNIHWSGAGDLKEILVYKRGVFARGVGSPIAIYDGEGNVVDEIDVPAAILDNEENVTSSPGDYFCCRADLWGDSRDEVIVAGRNGVRIHANRRVLAIPTLYNNTVYHGM
ncbi:MAG: hypothetical protein HY360_13265 [Verrucomicrobia bacterium]|nr:hypothetical protein [Verrucomicrobiota bacterium]